MSEGSRAIVEEAVAHFIDAFGRSPEWVAQAPGRVNLIGDHTDYAEGFVLPIAIDRRAVVVAGRAARAAPDATSGAVRSRLRSTARADEVRVTFADVARPTGTWADRLLGVAAAARRDSVPIVELDLLLHSDVPIGAGLSSSAAIEVALSTLLDAVGGRPLKQVEPVESVGQVGPAGRVGPIAPVGAIATARRCQAAEHEFAGVPCGIMDPLVSAAAHAGGALLIDCRSLCVEHVPIPPALAILVVETSARRDLAEGAYAARRRSVVEAAARLGVRTFRDLAPASSGPDKGATCAIDRLPEPLRSRARHVHSENRRVLAAADALRRGELERFGRLLFESHASLRDDFEVSTPELDRVVEVAESLVGAGVLGARLTGAGFGGAAIVAARRDRLDEVRDRLVGMLRASGAEPVVREAVPSEGAARLASRRFFAE